MEPRSPAEKSPVATSDVARGGPTPPATGQAAGPPKVPFGVNEVRLSSRQWLAALGVVALVIALTPVAWEHLERFEASPDYRVPYELSKDYWL